MIIMMMIVIMIMNMIMIIIIIITRPWPAFGQQGLVGSSGGYTYHGYTSHGDTSHIPCSMFHVPDPVPLKIII